MSSTAEHESQAWLNCGRQAGLYDPAMHIGQRIKLARLRIKPKVTQRQIADKCGITPQAVAGWEAGDSEPDAEKYPQLRDVLRVTYAYLLEGEGQPPPADHPELLLEDRAIAHYRAVGAKNAPAPTRRPAKA